ncbi:MAG: hypothetical protein OEY41_00415 [Acidimicrobiia bacterium]|nr:hypothetical protein [Acidimicrobiia bacterium]MDH5288441.1 hypothetical protein [Acidimicrobiia bacterium]
MDIEAITEQLWASGQAGDYFPAELVGKLDYEGGLKVQLGLLRRKLEAGERLGGWKVGLTSPRARAMIGFDERPFGHILASRILESGAEVDAALLTRGGVEPEMVFTFGETVDVADPTEAQLRAAVSLVAAGFELNERRPGTATAFDFPMMVADGMAQWGIVVGEGTSEVGDLQAVEVVMRANGEERARHVSRDVLDSHWASLARLAALLRRHGQRIEAGHRVITGAFCRLDVQAGDRWVADYTGLGTVEVVLV